MKISAPDYQLVVQALEQLPLRKDLRPEFYRASTSELLKSDFNIVEQLNRLESGAPVLSSRFISISHSEEFLAVLVSDNPCGVDVQVPDRKLNRGKDWFYNEEEQRIFGSKPSEDELYRIWCAKEAFYKMKQGKIDDLRGEVSVSELLADQTVLLYRGNAQIIKHFANDCYYLAYSFETKTNEK